MACLYVEPMRTAWIRGSRVVFPQLGLTRDVPLGYQASMRFRHSTARAAVCVRHGYVPRGRGYQAVAAWPRVTMAR